MKSTARAPRNLIAIGVVFLVLGALQIAVTHRDSSGYGIMTGGAMAVVAGAILVARQRPKSE
jgi:uncharacterized membrane protein HdeD (DUF308 family)